MRRTADGPSTEMAEDVAASQASARERLFRLLVPVCRELLSSRGATGLRADELRAYAERAGWLTGHEQGRFLSFLVLVFKAAGGIPQGHAPSEAPASRRRLVRVWVARPYAVAQGRGTPLAAVVAPTLSSRASALAFECHRLGADIIRAPGLFGPRRRASALLAGAQANLEDVRKLLDLPSDARNKG